MDSTTLGFAYQLTFVRLLGRFPIQEPLEIIEEILAFASIQLNVDIQHCEQYGSRQQTVSEHQESIRHYLGLQSFSTATDEVEAFLLKEACQLEQTAALLTRLKAFLKTRGILKPSPDTMLRLVRAQQEAARTAIYGKVVGVLSSEARQSLDTLISTEEDALYSPLHTLKQPPGNPSPASFIKLTEILEWIEKTGILLVDTAWLNNNFQRALARYARQCSLFQLRQLKEERRYTVLTCFLRQLYQDTYDAAVQMHDKLMNKMYNKADKEIDEYLKARRKNIRSSLSHYRKILGMLLDEEVEQKDLRTTIFMTIDAQTLKAEMDAIEEMLGNQYSDSFKRVIARYSYLRQFSPALLKHITFQADTQDKISDDLTEAVSLLNRMNDDGKHTLPENAPTGFIPKKLHPFVFQDGKPHKPAWECGVKSHKRVESRCGAVAEAEPICSRPFRLPVPH